MKRYFPVWALFVSLLVTGPVLSDPSTESASKTLRIMTVVIVQQGGFLQYLLDPYLADRKVTIQFSTGHHREVAAAVKRGDIDIAITHTKVKAMQKLAAAGVLVNGQVIFANPRAILGPTGDPAGVKGLHDAIEAMQRIQGNGYCYVINPHGAMEKLQRELLGNLKTDNTCVIDNADNTGNALLIAHETGAYTMWGLHPFLQKSDISLEPVVIPDPLLLENLGAWVVAGSENETQAAELVRYLASDAARERIGQFRLPGHENIQPWWFPVKKH